MSAVATDSGCSHSEPNFSVAVECKLEEIEQGGCLCEAVRCSGASSSKLLATCSVECEDLHPLASLEADWGSVLAIIVDADRDIVSSVLSFGSGYEDFLYLASNV